jgi:uracil-DNA glycosylase
MFSKSVRAFLQLICAARTGNAAYARSFADWPTLLADIERGAVDLEAPEQLAGRWVKDGVLLLNSSFTLSRFAVEVDPHQLRGHLPVWRPLILRVLQHLARSGRPIVFLGFGDAAAENLWLAGLAEPDAPLATIQRAHPAAADAVLALENPFLACNRFLQRMGARPVAW